MPRPEKIGPSHRGFLFLDELGEFWRQDRENTFEEASGEQLPLLNARSIEKSRLLSHPTLRSRKRLRRLFTFQFAVFLMAGSPEWNHYGMADDWIAELTGGAGVGMMALGSLLQGLAHRRSNIYGSK